MRMMDVSSWQSIVLTIGGLALVTLIGVGVRLIAMMTIQQRRERMNRQINERLRTLIAAYKTLGGSFTGDLAVDPAHLREQRRPERGVEDATAVDGATSSGSDRARRIRDAVQSALSDILLLGTDEHVRLAQQAAIELVAGRSVHTHQLVVALRDYVRHALQLDPIPADIAATIPLQGPTRPSGSGNGKGGSSGRDGGRNGGRGGGMGGGMAMGGVALGAGARVEASAPDEPDNAVLPT